MMPSATTKPLVGQGAPLVSKCQKCTENPKILEMPGLPEKQDCERNFERTHEKILSVIRAQFETFYEARLDWVKPYLDEERLGTANLQRQCCLVEEQKEENHSDDDNLSECTFVSSDMKGSDLDLDSELEEELIKLREDYWEHQIRITSLLETRPIDIGTVDEVLLFGSHRDRHNHIFTWKLEREKCAASGNRCGWSCRCCERPLGKYLEPAKDGEEEDERKEVEVLGHCTVQCGCYILMRGCYRPHTGLPPIYGIGDREVGCVCRLVNLLILASSIAIIG